MAAAATATAANRAAAGGLQFDLGRAVSLAGCAFKAYCEPKPVHPFTDFNVPDTTVMVLDKDFLQQAFWGVLEVQLVSAKNLPPGVPGELLSLPNTYAVVSLVSPKDLEARTRPLKFTSADVSRNPTWDQRKPPMIFPVREVGTDELRIELYDEAPSTHRPRRNQYPLGSAKLLLNEVANEGEEWRDKTLKLQPAAAPSSSSTAGELPAAGATSSDAGSVIIKVRLRPMKRADPHHLAALTTVKTMDMSWDAPMQIGLDVVEWLRRSAYDKVTWPYLGDVMEAAGAKVGDLYPLAFIDCRRTETEAWVFCNVEDRRVVVAFRGTNETGDWLVDLAMVLTPDDDIRPPDVAGPPGVEDPSKIRVHRGFLEGYRSVRKAVLSLVDEVLRADVGAPGPKSWKVEVTGHSLGAALATLAAYDIAWDKRGRDMQRQIGPTIGSVAMVNFGSPRVGNDLFVKDFNAVLPDAWRVHNHNDMVTSVPFTFGFWNFTHVGKDVRMGWDHMPRVAPHEVERWWVFKVLSTTPVSSHLEFRYQDTMLQMVRKWVQDHPPKSTKQGLRSGSK
ncbi:hypothetical protein PLESTB_000342800 [Pleodorina starrii]|uniref:C2 domain-containing protein n=1 Tax=Pleodorina starrii TaxID=330485 RepID=A0A9W6BEH3_9CHLO|nr:hypothetical protein PLESTM_000051900 [Pleodorina starrii]GLC50107.1 hypothetical protein PLESTB_000342800 [Pleodorina starrii]GLC73113.1 hypothetical protein PLESTF_001333600 [Pleodorina starrii]